MSDLYSPWQNRPESRQGHTDVRFEEGIGWDSDVTTDFVIGISQGSGVRPNQNDNLFYKTREETMQERAHVGSACWVDSPDHLSSFVAGTTDCDSGEYASDQRDGSHYSRPNHAKLWD